ncbi:MAG: tpiA [Bacillota bacterium]|jgi:triosephosphate isomerase|nr:tpiA [Bacillota bacterium]
MRKTLIAGNWKMNNNVKDSLELVSSLINAQLPDEVDVLICPPFTALYPINEILTYSEIKLGAQNMHFEVSGAYTGEVSPLMLKDVGVSYVIIGHSERRQYFNESDELVNEKIKSALIHDIKPILCVGESLIQRESNIEKETVKNQLINALRGIKSEDAKEIVIAYEPIWAIGTGKTATSEQANEMAAFIRNTVEEIYDINVSENLLVLYGGSVKGDNAAEIMSQSDIDGALVGGASLKAVDFLKIIMYNNHVQ